MVDQRAEADAVGETRTSRTVSIRVAVIGNHAHPFCSEVHWARAFAENGCDVTPIQVDDAVRHPHETMTVLRRMDAVTYTRTHAPNRYLDQSWTARWAELEDAGVRTIGIHLDRFWDLEREGIVHDDAQFTVGTLFTADGGNDDRWRAAGIRHEWFPPAIDATDAAHLGEVREEYQHDVIFVGSGRYHPSYSERDDLLRFLHDRFGDRFAHYGHGGGRPVVRGLELNDLYRSAKVVIGDSCFANSPDWQTKAHRYWSDRVPDVLGRQGFMIYPDVALDGYRAGKHYATYEPGNWDSLEVAVLSWLDCPAQRLRIASEATEHVRAHHTWRHRMTDVLATVGLDATVESRAS